MSATTNIIDETELTSAVVCGQRSYAVPQDVAAELAALRGCREALAWLTVAVDHYMNRATKDSTDEIELAEVSARAALAKCGGDK